MTGITFFLTAIAVQVPGHNTPDGVILRAVQVVVRSNVIEIRYQLGLHDNMIQRELRALAQPGSDIPADPGEAIARYRDEIAPLLPQKMRVTLEKKPVTMTVSRADIVRQPHRQLEIVYHIPFTPSMTPAKFVLWDDNFQGVPGYHFAAMRARGNAEILPVGGEKPLDRLPSVPEPGQVSSVSLLPMRGLAAYVCLTGASPPATDEPSSAPTASETAVAKAALIARNQETGTDQSPKSAASLGSASAAATELHATPVPSTPHSEPVSAVSPSPQRLLWSLGCAVVAVVIAVAWWWTSKKI